jgi:hypothetical protein
MFIAETTNDPIMLKYAAAKLTLVGSTLVHGSLFCGGAPKKHFIIFPRHLRVRSSAIEVLLDMHIIVFGENDTAVGTCATQDLSRSLQGSSYGLCGSPFISQVEGPNIIFKLGLRYRSRRERFNVSLPDDKFICHCPVYAHV